MLNFALIDIANTEIKNPDCSLLLRKELQKEVAILEKIKIELIDCRYSPEEFEQILEDYSLYFITKNHFDEMKRKCEKYDKIVEEITR